MKAAWIRGVVVITVLVALPCSPALAAEYLATITSPVYQTTGSTKEIAKRGSICLSQVLAKGSSDNPLIISSDLEAGIIVARNSIEYGSIARWKIRSRFTFEARDGRFRIEQTMLERLGTNFLTGNEAWGPIGKWSGSKWQEVTAKFEGSAAAVADCVINGAKRDNW